MNVIGLIGPVAAGKSTVAAACARRGAAVIDADRVGHEVLREVDVIAAVTRRFGREVLSPEGHIDRAAVAKIVFAPEGKPALADLERITHPRIAAELVRRIDEIKRVGTAAAIVIDAPVLLKAGWDQYCDRIVMVDAPREIRARRAAARGWTSDDLARREAAQESVDAKRAAADLIIDNSQSPDATESQLQRAWPWLTAPGASAGERSPHM